MKVKSKEVIAVAFVVVTAMIAFMGMASAVTIIDHGMCGNFGFMSGPSDFKTYFKTSDSDAASEVGVGSWVTIEDRGTPEELKQNARWTWILPNDDLYSSPYRLWSIYDVWKGVAQGGTFAAFMSIPEDIPGNWQVEFYYKGEKQFTDYFTIYSSILQSKIDAANPGDTILIEDGIYNDDYINVNKRLTIRSENGPSNCIVQAINPKAPVFEVSADYVNISGLTVKGADNGTRLFHADYCNISNNNYLYNDVGIYLSESNSSSISNNTCSNNNGDGIYLSYSSNNTISGNNVSNNNHSIALYSSSNNTIYLNNFINNNNTADSYASTNIWNSIEEITYTYLGTTYESYVGNYWDDYKEKYPDAEEIDSTGIWDTPYIIDGDEDNYPLMEPWENYIDTSHGPTKILFSDDFSDDGSGWVTYDGYDGRVIYEDGCLYVTDYTNPEFAIYGESRRYFTDFILEVETRQVGGTIDNWHVVNCRFKDEGNTYCFSISADGYYTIDKEVNGKVEVLAGPTYSAYIHQGQDVTNLIHVECIGSSLSLSVNGHLLRKVTDATFTGGDIALGANSLAGTFTEVAFDNLTVTKP